MCDYVFEFIYVEKLTFECSLIHTQENVSIFLNNGIVIIEI